MDDIEQLIRQILSRYNLSTENGRDEAYSECIEYAENELSHDINCNTFLRLAADILEKEPVEYDVIRDIVDMPRDAMLDFSYDERQGFKVTGNSSGLTYLAEILRILSEAPEGEHVHLFNDEEPMTPMSFNAVLYLEDDEWFDKIEEDGEDEQREGLPRRAIVPEDVFAIQVVGDLPQELPLMRDRLYKVEGWGSAEKVDSWKKPFSGNNNRFTTFQVTDENGDNLDIILHLDDPDINYFKKADFDGLID